MLQESFSNGVDRHFMVVPKGQFISTVANNGQSKAANYNSVNKRYGENNGGAVYG